MNICFILFGVNDLKNHRSGVSWHSNMRHWQTWALFSLASHTSCTSSWKVLLHPRGGCGEEQKQGAGQDSRGLLAPCTTWSHSTIMSASICLPEKPRYLHHESPVYSLWPNMSSKGIRHWGYLDLLPRINWELNETLYVEYKVPCLASSKHSRVHYYYIF